MQGPGARDGAGNPAAGGADAASALGPDAALLALARGVRAVTVARAESPQPGSDGGSPGHASAPAAAAEEGSPGGPWPPPTRLDGGELLRELADLAGDEIRRLLRYTLKREVRRDPDVDVTSRNIEGALKAFFAKLDDYVGFAVRRVEGALRGGRGYEGDAGPPSSPLEVEAAILQRQLKQALAHGKEMGARLEEMEQRDGRQVTQFKELRQTYFKEIQSWKQRCSALQMRFVSLSPIDANIENLAEDVTFFDEKDFIDEDTMNVLKAREKELTERHQIDMQVLHRQIHHLRNELEKTRRDLTAAEDDALNFKTKLRFEQQKSAVAKTKSAPAPSTDSQAQASPASPNKNDKNAARKTRATVMAELKEAERKQKEEEDREMRSLMLQSKVDDSVSKLEALNKMALGFRAKFDEAEKERGVTHESTLAKDMLFQMSSWTGTLHSSMQKAATPTAATEGSKALLSPPEPAQKGPDLTQELNAAKAKIAELEGKISSLEAQAAAATSSEKAEEMSPKDRRKLQAEIDAKDKELKQLKSKVSIAEQGKHHALEELDESNKKAAELQRRLTELEAAAKDVKEARVDAVGNLKAQSRELSALRAELDEAVAARARLQARLGEDASNLQTALEEAEKERDLAKETAERLVKDLDAARKKEADALAAAKAAEEAAQAAREALRSSSPAPESLPPPELRRSSGAEPPEEVCREDAAVQAALLTDADVEAARLAGKAEAEAAFAEAHRVAAEDFGSVAKSEAEESSPPPSPRVTKTRTSKRGKFATSGDAEPESAPTSPSGVFKGKVAGNMAAKAAIRLKKVASKKKDVAPPATPPASSTDVPPPSTPAAEDVLGGGDIFGGEARRSSLASIHDMSANMIPKSQADRAMKLAVRRERERWQALLPRTHSAGELPGCGFARRGRELGAAPAEEGAATLEGLLSRAEEEAQYKRCRALFHSHGGRLVARPKGVGDAPRPSNGSNVNLGGVEKAYLRLLQLAHGVRKWQEENAEEQLDGPLSGDARRLETQELRARLEDAEAQGRVCWELQRQALLRCQRVLGAMRDLHGLDIDAALVAPDPGEALRLLDGDLARGCPHSEIQRLGRVERRARAAARRGAAELHRRLALEVGALAPYAPSPAPLPVEALRATLGADRPPSPDSSSADSALGSASAAAGAGDGGTAGGAADAGGAVEGGGGAEGGSAAAEEAKVRSRRLRQLRLAAVTAFRRARGTEAAAGALLPAGGRELETGAAASPAAKAADQTLARLEDAINKEAVLMTQCDANAETTAGESEDERHDPTQAFDDDFDALPSFATLAWRPLRTPPDAEPPEESAGTDEDIPDAGPDAGPSPPPAASSLAPGAVNTTAQAPGDPPELADAASSRSSPMERLISLQIPPSSRCGTSPEFTRLASNGAAPASRPGTAADGEEQVAAPPRTSRTRPPPSRKRFLSEGGTMASSVPQERPKLSRANTEGGGGSALAPSVGQLSLSQLGKVMAAANRVMRMSPSPAASRSASRSASSLRGALPAKARTISSTSRSSSRTASRQGAQAQEASARDASGSAGGNGGGGGDAEMNDATLDRLRDLAERFMEETGATVEDVIQELSVALGGLRDCEGMDQVELLAAELQLHTVVESPSRRCSDTTEGGEIWMGAAASEVDLDAVVERDSITSDFVSSSAAKECSLSEASTRMVASMPAPDRKRWSKVMKERRNKLMEFEKADQGVQTMDTGGFGDGAKTMRFIQKEQGSQTEVLSIDRDEGSRRMHIKEAAMRAIAAELKSSGWEPRASKKKKTGTGTATVLANSVKAMLNARSQSRSVSARPFVSEGVELAAPKRKTMLRAKTVVPPSASDNSSSATEGSEASPRRLRKSQTTPIRQKRPFAATIAAGAFFFISPVRDAGIAEAPDESERGGTARGSLGAAELEAPAPTPEAPAEASAEAFDEQAPEAARPPTAPAAEDAAAPDSAAPPPEAAEEPPPAIVRELRGGEEPTEEDIEEGAGHEAAGGADGEAGDGGGGIGSAGVVGGGGSAGDVGRAHDGPAEDSGRVERRPPEATPQAPVVVSLPVEMAMAAKKSEAEDSEDASSAAVDDDEHHEDDDDEDEDDDSEDEDEEPLSRATATPGTAGRQSKLMNFLSGHDDMMVELVDIGQQADLVWDAVPGNLLGWLRLNLMQRQQAAMYCTEWQVTELQEFGGLGPTERERMLREFEDFLYNSLCLARPDRAVSHRRQLRQRFRRDIFGLEEGEAAPSASGDDSSAPASAPAPMQGHGRVLARPGSGVLGRAAPETAPMICISSLSGPPPGEEDAVAARSSGRGLAKGRTLLHDVSSRSLGGDSTATLSVGAARPAPRAAPGGALVPDAEAERLLSSLLGVDLEAARLDGVQQDIFCLHYAVGRLPPEQRCRATTRGVYGLAESAAAEGPTEPDVEPPPAATDDESGLQPIASGMPELEWSSEVTADAPHCAHFTLEAPDGRLALPISSRGAPAPRRRPVAREAVAQRLAQRLDALRPYKGSPIPPQVRESLRSLDVAQVRLNAHFADVVGSEGLQGDRVAEIAQLVAASTARTAPRAEEVAALSERLGAGDGEARVAAISAALDGLAREAGRRQSHARELLHFAFRKLRAHAAPPAGEPPPAHSPARAPAAELADISPDVRRLRLPPSAVRPVEPPQQHRHSLSKPRAADPRHGAPASGSFIGAVAWSYGRPATSAQTSPGGGLASPGGDPDAAPHHGGRRRDEDTGELRPLTAPPPPGHPWGGKAGAFRPTTAPGDVTGLPEEDEGDEGAATPLSPLPLVRSPSGPSPCGRPAVRRAHLQVLGDAAAVGGQASPRAPMSPRTPGSSLASPQLSPTGGGPGGGPPGAVSVSSVFAHAWGKAGGGKLAMNRGGVTVLPGIAGGGGGRLGTASGGARTPRSAR